MSKRSGPFWDAIEGRAPMPRAAATLGAFRLVRSTGSVILMVPVWPESGSGRAQLRRCALRRAAWRVRWSRSGRLGAARAASA